MGRPIVTSADSTNETYFCRGTGHFKQKSLYVSGYIQAFIDSSLYCSIQRVKI